MNKKLQDAARELNKTFIDVKATVVGDEIHITYTSPNRDIEFAARVFAAFAKMSAHSFNASGNSIRLYDAKKK